MSTGNEETNGNGTNETGTPTRDVQTPAVMPTSTTNVTTRKLAATLQGVYTKIDNKKADKITGDGHNGHLVDIDSNGNIHDSGKSPSDFATSAQGDKADTAVQSVKMVSNSGTELKNGTSVIIPLAAPTGTGASPGLMSAADKKKLDDIAAGAQVNQNAFSNIKVGNSTIAADTTTDTLELVAGTHITLTPNTTDDKITIGSNLESKAAASGGNAVSLVTTGEKYTWNSKQDALAFEGTYNETSNKVATESTVSDAITGLSYQEVGGDGKYIKAISETNGVINATVETMDTTPTASSTKAVTSGGIKTALDTKANLASPTFTGTPNAPTAAAGTNTTQIATTAFVVNEIDAKMASTDAMIYKGTIAGGNATGYGALTPAANKGWTYKVSTAGKINGVTVEVGDMLICNTDNTTAATSSDYSTIKDNWDYIQTNIDGYVIGPDSSTAGKVAGFDDASGKKIRELTSAEIKSAANLDLVVNQTITVTNTSVSDGTHTFNKYVHPTTTEVPAAAVKVGKDSTGHVVLGSALTKSDVGLGNVVNTGDSAVPVSGGTTKFTTGGAFTELAKKVDKVAGKDLSTNDFTDGYKEKLDGIQAGAEVNQNAFSNVKVGSGDSAPILSADSKTDTLNIIGGTHLTVTGTADTNTLEITTDLSSRAAAQNGTTESLVTTGEKYTWNSKAAGSHSHGNITSGGAISSDTTIGSGDKIVITDSSGSNNVARSPITFDGSTTTTALTPKGTWESFAKAADITTAIDGLDAAVTSSDGTNVQVKVTETNGKISAVNITTDKTEDKNNKVTSLTSWSSTPNDTHYPSEKLVKDSLDGKASSTHAHGNITNAGKITATGVAIENTDTLVIVDKTDDLVKQTSIAFDGTTTNKALTPAGSWEPFAKSADITTAINGLDSAVTSSDGTNVQVKVTEADGKITAVNITTDKTEDKNNKVKSWSSTTTDTHYPSEKLVKDSLDDKADKVSNATSGHLAGLDANGNLTDSGKAVSDLADAHHSHGNITEDGSILSNDVSQAILSSHCSLVFTDQSNKIKKTSITFDALSDYKALTQKGTFETLVKNVKLDGASSNLTNTNGTVTIPNAVATGASGATNGLMTAADKLKLDNLDNAHLGQGYGTCSTAEATAAKAVTLSSYELTTGGIVAVKFTNGLCANATLNINSKGAKDIFINGAAVTATTCKNVLAGDIAYFIYDGTQYQFLGTDRTRASVDYDSTNKKITKTIDGVTTDVVTVSTIKSDLQLTKSDVGLGNVDNTADANKNVLSATKLTTARKIDGVSFDGTADIVHYGECSTVAGTVAKVVTLSGNVSFTLAAGASVFVKFQNSNTAASPTLNVNGTGAKAIYRYGTTIPGTIEANSWKAGSVVHLVYDGSTWQMVGWLNDDHTYTNAALGQGYGTCSTAEATAAKTVSLSSYALATGGIVAVKFTNGLCASATMNINSKGAKNIFIHGAAVTSTTAKLVKAGDIAYFIYDGTQYHFLGTDRTRAEISYDTTNKKITQTIDGVTSDVVTIADIKSDLAIKNAEYGNGYGTCETAAATTTKVVALTNYELVENGIVAVKFTYAVPAGALLNINSKGAIPIYYSGAAISGDIIQGGDIGTFVLTGTGNNAKYVLLSVDRSAGEMTDQEVQDLIDALV